MTSAFIGDDPDLEGLGTIVFVAVIVGFIATFWLNLWTLTALLVAAVGVLMATLSMVQSRQREVGERLFAQQADAEREEEKRLLLEHVSRHSETLSGRYRLMVSTHGYGQPEQSPWQKEMLRFMLAVDFDPAHMTLDEVAWAVARTLEQQKDGGMFDGPRNITPRRRDSRNHRFYRPSGPRDGGGTVSKFRPPVPRSEAP